MEFVKKLLLLLSAISFGCSNKTYYVYSYQSTQRTPMQLDWIGFNGSIQYKLQDTNPLTLPDGTKYTAVFYEKNWKDSYLWPDAKLVKVECTPKDVVKRNKEFMKLIKGK